MFPDPVLTTYFNDDAKFGPHDQMDIVVSAKDRGQFYFSRSKSLETFILAKTHKQGNDYNETTIGLSTLLLKRPNRQRISRVVENKSLCIVYSGGKNSLQTQHQGL